MAKIKKVTGFCNYCSQGRLVDVPDNEEFTQDELNRIATDECECPQAIAHREREDKIERAEYYINNLVPEQEEHAKPLLRAAVPLLIDRMIKKMSINVDGRVTYAIYRGKEDSIIAQRQETIVREEEIE